MKKHVLIILIIVSVFAVKAQLSGSYTIGGVTPDFVSLDSALYSLRNQGASDTVIFNIRPGDYSSIRIKFYEINTSFPVIVQSESLDSSSVIIKVASFYKCKNVIVNALTIYPNVGTCSGGGYNYMGMEIYGSSYVTISNCAFVKNGSANNAISIVKANSHKLINNSFVGFDHAISISNMTFYRSNMHLGNNIIKGCIIDSCEVGIRVMGRIISSLEISYNTIKNCEGGIYLDGNGQDISYTDIHHNEIYNTDGYCINSVSNSNSTSINIYNNMLSGGKNWGFNVSSSAGQKHVFILISVNLKSSKSVKFTNNSVAGCVYLDGSNSIQIKNNCLSSDSSLLLYVNSSCSNIVSDYNNL